MTPDQLRAWRKRLGLKQREAAEALGVHRNTYMHWEQGSPRIPKTAELACAALALGITEFPIQPE